MSDDTRRPRRRDVARRPNHPLFARVYARQAPQMDAAGLLARRRALVAGLRGEVVEIGAGNGLQFPHYPASVGRVVAVEPERHLRELAERAATTAPVRIEVVDALAEDLPLAGASVDAAVVALVLCSVADQARVLAEVRRVLRPGGELRFLEHVRADTRGLVRVQRAMDATFWPHVAGGCHSGRDTVAAIGAAGFEVGELERFWIPEGGVRLPNGRFVRGVATAA